MASQQQPAARPWFRLGSMARPAPPVPTPAPAPAPTPTPQAQPPAPQPRPPFLRPTFVTPTPQPQPPPPPPPPAAQPPPPTTTTTVPVPRSPVVPTSTPSPKTSPTDSTALPIASASVPSSPKLRASVPSSPAPKSVPSPSQAREPPQLASPVLIRPPATPAPAPAQLPSPILIRPPAPAQLESLASAPPISATAKPASPSPAPPPISTAAKPVSPSPVRVGVVAAAPTTTTTTMTTQVPSPKIVQPIAKTKSPSPMAPRAKPPSPLILPQPQLKYGVQPEQRQKNIPPEAEQKTVLVQETAEKPKVKPSGFGIYNNNNAPAVGKPDATKVDKGNHKKPPSDSEDLRMRIITIAGENSGAIMELSPSRNNNNIRFGFGGKPQSLLQNHGNPPGSTSTNGGKYVSSSTDEEGRPKIKDKNGKAITKTTSSPPLNAFMNSNVQSVNNSILYNTSCTYHDPGIRLSLSSKSNAAHNAHGINIRDRTMNAQNGRLRQREE